MLPAPDWRVGSVIAQLTQSDTVYGDCSIGDACAYAKLPYEPDIGQNVIGDLRHGVRRVTVCECREEDELIREVSINGGAGAKVRQQRARDEFTDRFGGAAKFSRPVSAKPAGRAALAPNRQICSRVSGIIVEYSFDVTRQTCFLKRCLTGCCHPIADPPSGEEAGNGDSAHGVHCASINQGKASQPLWGRNDGQLKHACTAGNVTGPFDPQIDVRVHAVEHRRQHMLEMVRGRRKVLEHAAFNARSDGRVGKAGDWQHAQREHRRRSRRPDVPLEPSSRDSCSRHEGKFAALDMHALR